MTVRILNGDCREVLRSLPDATVNCCVTSPPYFGQRDYGMEEQIGQERTPEEYVNEMVGVFSEVRRVLRPDGTLWLNIGESYATSGRGGNPTMGSSTLRGGHRTQQASAASRKRSRSVPGLKPKDLIGIPWMVAFALRADGWYLRSCNIWAKPNGMPDSAKDRPSPAHEYVFQFAKSHRYYHGYQDVRLPPVPESVARLARSMKANLDRPEADRSRLVLSGGGYAPPGQPPHASARWHDVGASAPGQEPHSARRRPEKLRGHQRQHTGLDVSQKAAQQADGAALRSVWWISPGGFAEAHFAVMPAELAAVCILAGCPKGGVCLDPFGGAGTTGLVADRLGRDAILIEMNPEYVAMAEARIRREARMFADISVEQLEVAS